MPSLAKATKRGKGLASQPVGVYYKRARLFVDSADRVWIAYRHYYAPWMGIEPHHHIDGGWRVYARCLSGTGWSELFGFTTGQGDGLQRLELAGSSDRLNLVWTTGRNDRRRNNVAKGLVLAEIDLRVLAPDPVNASSRLTMRAEPVSPRRNESPRKVQLFAGHELVFCDLHRHTDLSLCFVPMDGTIDDAYRYAIDVAKLDFLGITDHSRDLARGDLMSMLWWRSRKEVTRHRLGTRFIPYFAYERSRGDTDHNVISLSGDVLRPHTYPLPQFWNEIDSKTITIPHKPFDRLLWRHKNDRARPLLEIFQGYRDSSVEVDADAGWLSGHRFGLIASSDQLSTSASYAGVWTETRTSEAIFIALQARRTFAATDKIQLVVRAGDNWMGEAVIPKKCRRTL